MLEWSKYVLDVRWVSETSESAGYLGLGLLYKICGRMVPERRMNLPNRITLGLDVASLKWSFPKMISLDRIIGSYLTRKCSKNSLCSLWIYSGVQVTETLRQDRKDFTDMTIIKLSSRAFSVLLEKRIFRVYMSCGRETRCIIPGETPQDKVYQKRVHRKRFILS